MDNNRPCYSNRGSVFDQKNDNSNLSTSAVIIAGNMVHISNFWGEFDQQSDRNRGHYYRKYVVHYYEFGQTSIIQFLFAIYCHTHMKHK